MKLVIWYNTQTGKYDFGTAEEFRAASNRFELIHAEESFHLPMKTVARLTAKLNENLAITKLSAAA